ncbi:MAG: hypothetical protein II658_07895, partial [Prevotella sp.]|nr:hypothetical protein [Prevotella sp.]
YNKTIEFVRILWFSRRPPVIILKRLIANGLWISTPHLRPHLRPPVRPPVDLITDGRSWVRSMGGLTGGLR